MDLTLLPLLQTQREIYTIERGMARFQAYLAIMTGGSDDIVLPLVSMNPLGKDHLPPFLDALIALDAEAVAALALDAAAARLAHVAGRVQVGLVATDDQGGGWTNRFFTDLGMRLNPTPMLRRGFIVVPLWTSEVWDEETIRSAVGVACFRTAWIQQYGQPRTLDDLLRQEGLAALFAGAAPPPLDADDLAYTREVLVPYRASIDYPTIFTGFFGDAAAREAGYPPLGLSPLAGLALAYAEAIAAGRAPEAAISGTGQIRQD